jgi:hypothetical protein
MVAPKNRTHAGVEYLAAKSLWINIEMPRQPPSQTIIHTKIWREETVIDPRSLVSNQVRDEVPDPECSGIGESGDQIMAGYPDLLHRIAKMITRRTNTSSSIPVNLLNPPISLDMREFRHLAAPLVRRSSFINLTNRSMLKNRSTTVAAAKTPINVMSETPTSQSVMGKMTIVKMPKGT